MTARSVSTFALVLAVTLTAGPLLAQTNVGVVNFDLVFRDSARAKVVFGDVENFRRSKAAELQAMQEAYQSKLQRMQSDQALGDVERATLAQELRSEQTKMKRLQEDAEREGQRMTNKALAVLDKEIGPLVREVAAEKNLQLILQNIPDLGIVFADPAIDVTADIIAKLDAQ